MGIRSADETRALSSRVYSLTTYIVRLACTNHRNHLPQRHSRLTQATLSRRQATGTAAVRSIACELSHTDTHVHCP
eukprot:6152887-Prymnesium_polylepis.1